MADSYIQAPLDGVGKKIDTDQLTVGANTVHRERDQIAGLGADDVAVVVDTDPGATDHGIVVRQALSKGPITDALSSSSLAAGASVSLDGTTIASGKTGKLLSAIVGSTAACKWVIALRDGAVVTSIGVAFTSGLAGNVPTLAWVPPDKSFDTIAGAGVDENFRVTVTNLDAENAADVYATIYWDEV